MAAEDQRKLTLVSSDGQTFTVDEKVAFKSGTVKQLVSDVESATADQQIPVQVKANILSKVIEFCNFHVKEAEKKELAGEEDDVDDDDEEEEEDEDDFDLENEKSKKESEEVKAFHKAFVDVEQHVLFDLMLAANYMDVKDLLNFLIQTVADMIVACKDPAEIRAKFNIEDDLTPEEVEEIKRNNTWAFE